MSWIDSLIPSAGVNTNQPNPYLTGYGSSASGLAGGLGAYNLGGQNLNQFQGLTQAGVSNPFAGGYQSGAGTAGQMGQQAGMGTFGAGGQLQQAGQGLLGDINPLISMGYDPQQALYARTQQQVTDQSNAAAAASGVGGTPYGQGVTGQTLSNFNIDWQNQQLGRATQAAGAASGLAGAGAGAIGAGANTQNAGISQYLQGAGQPYQTYAGINQNQLQLLNQANQYGQGAAAIPQMQEQDYQQLAQGQGQYQNQQTALQLQQAQQEYQQAMGIGQAAGSALGGLGGMTGFGGGAGGTGNMNFNFGGGQGGGFGSGFGGYGQFGNSLNLGQYGAGYPGFRWS